MSTNKLRAAVPQVVRALCGVDPGERIPTVSELVETCGASRGSVQNALAHLKEVGAVELEPHGKRGTFLESVDYLALAREAGIDHLVGVMPLPYTRRYEGIATGLFTLFYSRSDLRTYITFLRGSEGRVRSLDEGFANYCVLSRLAFDTLSSAGEPLKSVLDLGEESYVGRHVIVRREGDRNGWDGARIGVDSTSVDQRLLTERYFSGDRVEFVPTQYSNIVEMVRTFQIDAAIWNVDDIRSDDGLIVEELGPAAVSGDDSRAIVAVRSGDDLCARLLAQLVDVDELKRIQHAVMTGELLPRY